MIRKIVPFALISLIAVGCEKNEFTVPVPAGGGAIPAQQAPSQTAPTIPPVHPILQDPETHPAPQYDEPVLAADAAEADRICRKKAEEQGVELVRVQPPSKIRKGKNQTYRCWFQG
jgi:hypothetical protein